MAADRGKVAEGDFRKVCKKYETRTAFAFHRFPDAHSGSMVPAPADFQTMSGGTMRLIEVKETAVEGRLPYLNFKPDQVARMRLWEAAGAESWVVISHTTSGTYRVARAQNFLKRETCKASWFFTEPAFLNDDHRTFDSMEAAFKFIHKLP